MAQKVLPSEFAVSHHVRAVLDSVVVVVEPGDVIARVLAERLGLCEPTRPRPNVAKSPNLRKRGT